MGGKIILGGGKIMDTNGQALIDNAENQIFLLSEADKKTGAPHFRDTIEDWHDAILHWEDDGAGRASGGYNSLLSAYREWADAWRERSQARQAADANSPCGDSKCARCNAGKECQYTR